MTKLKNLVARLSRKVTEDSKHTTVFGETVYTTFTCKVCKEPGYLSEAYLKSKSQRKHCNDIREYHASCWNISNGKVKKNPDKSTGSLLSFFNT